MFLFINCLKIFHFIIHLIKLIINSFSLRLYLIHLFWRQSIYFTLQYYVI